MHKHSALSNKIPSREKCQIIRTSNDAIAEKSIRHNKSVLVNTTKTSLLKSKGHGITAYKCHICDSKMQKFSNLCTHMAVAHFKNNLKKHYGEKEWECKLCKKEFNGERKLLSHLGNLHQALKSLMPERESLRIQQPPCDTNEAQKCKVNDRARKKQV